MPEPELIQRQREAIRSFRRIDRARSDAETAAHQQHAQTTASADAAFKTARQSAENARAQALAAAENQRQAAQGSAASALESIRIRARQQTDASAAAARNGRDAVQKAGLDRLWPAGHTPIGAVASAQAETELARRVQLAGQTGKKLGSAMDERKEAQARRRRAILYAALVGILVLVIALWRFQARQTELRAQATATAIAPQAKQLADATGIEFVYVLAGEFTMGSPNWVGEGNERPQHTVFLDDFWIGKTEVTNAQYARCVEAGVCPAPNNNLWNDSTFAEHPVANVSWDSAVAYSRWLTEQSGVSVRLPSEAEWEKAARGTDGRIYPWGDAEPNERLLNYEGNVGSTTPVGSYPEGVSPYGALDMAGNVWEWVGDRYGTAYYGESSARNPTGPESGHYLVLRGGSFNTIHYNTRCAYRNRNNPDFRDTNYGFRLLSPGS